MLPNDGVSYWGSYAETPLSMADSSSTTSAPTEIQVSTDYTMTIIGTGIAMIIAVAIATDLILRKNP